MNQLDGDGNNVVYWATECRNSAFLALPNIPELKTQTGEERMLAILARRPEPEPEPEKGGKKKK